MEEDSEESEEPAWLAASVEAAGRSGWGAAAAAPDSGAGVPQPPGAPAPSARLERSGPEAVAGPPAPQAGAPLGAAAVPARQAAGTEAQAASVAAGLEQPAGVDSAAGLEQPAEVDSAAAEEPPAQQAADRQAAGVAAPEPVLAAAAERETTETASVDRQAGGCTAEEEGPAAAALSERAGRPPVVALPARGQAGRGAEVGKGQGTLGLLLVAGSLAAVEAAAGAAAAAARFLGRALARPRDGSGREE